MDLKRNLLPVAMALALMVVHTVPAFAAEQVQDTVVSEDSGPSLYTYKYIVVGNDVRVRATPSLSGTVLGHMQWGGVVYDTGRFADADGYHWMQVRCGAPLTGTIGWIASDYLMQDPDD